MRIQSLAGSRYKVTLDESFKVETDTDARRDRWRYEEIRGRKGFVYLYSAGQLAVTFRSIIIANRFNGRGWGVIQDGDTERTVLFPTDAAPEVLAAIQPRRVRVLKPEEREKAVARLAKFRASQKNPALNALPRPKV